MKIPLILIEELADEIDKIPVIDTHEYILPEGWTSEKGSGYSLIIRKRK